MLYSSFDSAEDHKYIGVAMAPLTVRQALVVALERGVFSRCAFCFLGCCVGLVTSAVLFNEH
jgi:hypothetical protein